MRIRNGPRSPERTFPPRFSTGFRSAPVVAGQHSALRRLAHPHDGILGYVPGIAGMHDVDDYPLARQVPGLVVYRYDSPLCFANAQDFRRRALAALAEA